MDQDQDEAQKKIREAVEAGRLGFLSSICKLTASEAFFHDCVRKEGPSRRLPDPVLPTLDELVDRWSHEIMQLIEPIPMTDGTARFTLLELTALLANALQLGKES